MQPLRSVARGPQAHTLAGVMNFSKPRTAPIVLEYSLEQLRLCQFEGLGDL